MANDFLEFWREKIAANHERDRAAIGAFPADGWRVLIVWEYALRRAQKRQPEEIIEACADLLSLSATSSTHTPSVAHLKSDLLPSREYAASTEDGQ